ncbi:MAG: hypothetical protein KDG50_15955 [Chromatiales bacterium]|nr:hypothetical protein [Chromatiales bacterium]
MFTQWCRPLPMAGLVFGLALIVPGAGALAAGSATGHYVGNGRDAKLPNVSVIKNDGWEGRKGWTIIASEKPSGGSKKPDFDAQFGKLGDALVLSVTEDGELFSAQICHQALKRSGFSSSGTIKVNGFSMKGGEVSAHFTTDGERSFFDDKWSVDLKINAPLPK